jgi:hypothetical protein
MLARGRGEGSGDIRHTHLGHLPVPLQVCSPGVVVVQAWLDNDVLYGGRPRVQVLLQLLQKRDRSLRPLPRPPTTRNNQLVSKLTFITHQQKVMKFVMNLMVHGQVDGVCDGHMRSLVEA